MTESAPGATWPQNEQVPVCRACRKPLDWRSMKTDDREFAPGVFERVYFCPHCRAIQDYGSWQTGDK